MIISSTKTPYLKAANLLTEIHWYHTCYDGTSEFLAGKSGRLRALATLDPDFALVIHVRDERRRRGGGVIAQRLSEQQMLAPSTSLDEIVTILFTLSSFETFDTLAGPIGAKHMPDPPGWLREYLFSPTTCGTPDLAG